MIFCFTVDTDGLCARGLAGYRDIKIPRGSDRRPCNAIFRLLSSTDFSRSVTQLTLLFLPEIERRKKKRKRKKISPSKSIPGQLIAFSTTVLILRDDRFQFFIASAFFAVTRQPETPKKMVNRLFLLLLFFQKRRIQCLFIISSKLTTNVQPVTRYSNLILSLFTNGEHRQYVLVL